MDSVTAIDNRRKDRRFPTHHPAKIMLGPEAMISCLVKDISTGGARIAVKRHMDLPESFELYIAAHDLQVRRARVCWRNGDFAGVAFSAEEADLAPAADGPDALRFEVCLEQAAMPPHLASKPARKNLKLYRTTA
ncbi:PilZ domain-containing protein [Microvirga mediterraneensis]|uniref:PilZ domain-containing protein n=1 Tax=Microvirga mediterraneensis TaxID=2754695 RepID=A0A838BSL8_9HYPH|nr:PilZ domain-containing protein [Microvirga mediterraneensis]MBA1158431.1 PilZ domain-containing protein [Microvirga mediterraneensis]